MLSFIESQGTFCWPTRHRAKNGGFNGANLESFTEVEDASDVAFCTDVKLGVDVEPMLVSWLTDVEGVALWEDEEGVTAVALVKDVKGVELVKDVKGVAFFKDAVAEPLPIWSREISLSRAQSLSTQRF